MILPVVPMFHVNAWGLPFAAAMTGAGLVLPGSRLDPISLLDLLAAERVTLVAGVPTVFMGVLEALDAQPEMGPELPAAGQPRWSGDLGGFIEGFERHGLTIIQGWGMTETSPLGTVSRLRRDLRSAPEAEQLEYRARAGTPIPLIEIRARADDGTLIPWDDRALGELEIRGPWVASGYHRGTGADRWTDDGWFRTGDVGRIDQRGCMRICDRAKDLIKSGGEWISSVDLENQLMSHRAVAEAAVIAIPDDKWGERPLAAVVLRAGRTAAPGELREHLAHRLRQVAAARSHRVHRGDPPDGDRQVPKDCAARSLRGEPVKGRISTRHGWPERFECQKGGRSCEVDQQQSPEGGTGL